MVDDSFDTPRPGPEYPLKSPAVLKVVNRYAPEYSEQFGEITEPGLSGSPDALEKWEAENIGRRKNRISIETDDFRYALRVLYEESFSVNQFPEEPMDDSLAPTIGGFISHFYDFNSYDDVSLADFHKWGLRGKTLKEIITNEPDVRKREHIFDWGERVTYQGDYYMRRMGNFQRKAQFLRDPEQINVRPEMNSYGARMLSLVSKVPEITEDVIDPELRKMCGVHEGVKYTKAQFVRFLWRKLSPMVFDSAGEASVYKHEDETKAQEAIKILVQLRTHPEFQFLYKYKSTSGFLNENGSSSTKEKNTE